MGHDHDHAGQVDPSPADRVDHVDLLTAESARIAELAATADLEARVPGCPDWNLRQLIVHLGDVQRWATGIIETGEANPQAWHPDEALDVWFRAGTDGLLAAIAATDPSAECWNLWATAEKTVGFWHRRQALEAAMHRWDAESATSTPPTPFTPRVGADLIDEWVHIMLPRAIEKSGTDLSSLAGDVHFHCTDTPGEWTFEIIDGAVMVVDEHRKSAVAARGPASELALLCYNRGDRSGVEIFGDSDLLDRWLG